MTTQTNHSHWPVRDSGYGRSCALPMWSVSTAVNRRRVVSIPFLTMSTRSFIARKTEEDFEGVYCHWDGYLEHNGAILLEHYDDPAKLAELLSLGDISLLGPSVGEKHSFDDRDEECTTYYGRDRGEPDSQIRTKRYESLKALMDDAADCGCEYFYLYDGDWKYAERGPQFFGLSDGSPFSEFASLERACKRV